MLNVNVILAFLFTSAICALTSCDNQTVSEPENSVESYNHQEVGDSLSMISQQVLLSNVGRELKAGGAVNAIDFCNLNASSLMDSLSKEYNVKISRVTSQPRNPSNMVSNIELSILESLMKSNSKDTLVNIKDDVVYYKSIKLGMPTCLKCHGSADDIDEKTLGIIQARYPNDRATGYKLGDFRGAWKIRFED